MLVCACLCVSLLACDCVDMCAQKLTKRYMLVTHVNVMHACVHHASMHLGYSLHAQRAPKVCGGNPPCHPVRFMTPSWRAAAAPPAPSGLLSTPLTLAMWPPPPTSRPGGMFMPKDANNVSKGFAFIEFSHPMVR